MTPKALSRENWGGQIYKIINGMRHRLDKNIFVENWKSQKARLQKEYPTAKIKYSYKTKQFTIFYPLPNDYVKIISFGLANEIN